MTALNENLKKHFADIGVDLVKICLFLVGLYLIGLFIGNQINLWGALASLALVVAFYYMGKLIDKKFSVWKVPEMEIEDKKTFLHIDLAYSLSVGAILILILYYWGHMFSWVMVGLIAFMIFLRERKKWKNFGLAKQEAESTTDEAPIGPIKKAEPFVQPDEPELDEPEEVDAELMEEETKE